MSETELSKERRSKMNKITIELSDEALADLHAIQLVLREKWRASPGMADHVCDTSRGCPSRAVRGHDWRLAHRRSHARLNGLEAVTTAGDPCRTFARRGQSTPLGQVCVIGLV